MKTLLVKIPQSGEKKTVPVTTTSKQFTSSLRDNLIGLLFAVGTPVLTYAYDLIMLWTNHQEVDFDPRTAVKYGLAAGFLYIGKNFIRPSSISIKAKELLP